MNLGGVDIEFAQARGDEAIQRQMAHVSDLLEKIAAEVEKPKPDKGKVTRPVQNLREMAVAGVIGEFAWLLLSQGRPLAQQ